MDSSILKRVTHINLQMTAIKVVWLRGVPTQNLCWTTILIENIRPSSH